MKKIRKLNDGFDLQSTVRGTTLNLTDERMYQSVHSSYCTKKLQFEYEFR